MAMGDLETLVNAQVSASVSGQAIGPGFGAAQALSPEGAVSQSFSAGISGVIEGIVENQGSGEVGGNAAGVSAEGENPLVDAQLSGAEIGQALGPAESQDGNIPVTDRLPLSESGSQGPLGSSAQTFTGSGTGNQSPSVSSTPNLPNVGGVLFGNCEVDMTEIGEIVGAYWDQENGSIVFIGKPGDQKSTERMGLPQMDQDHLMVALRSFFAGEPMGVSIDPPAKYNEDIRKGVFPPDGSHMLVSYLGGTEKTLCGAIMFEADRLMKCLGNGVDNNTKKTVRAEVPGFKTILEMQKLENLETQKSENQYQKISSHRFWFVIDKVELKHDPGTGAIKFGDTRLKVLTETELYDKGKKNDVDPVDKEFVDHLTIHYDAYAKEFPVLARLKELAKIAAVVKFLCNQGISLDLGSIFQYEPQFVDTPSSTPGITVKREEEEYTETREYVRKYVSCVSLFGGVDMDPELVIQGDVADAATAANPGDAAHGVTAKQLKDEAEKTCPSASTRSWKIGNELKALAQRIGKPLNPCKKFFDDHAFTTGGSLLRVRRTYDSVSVSIREGDFGPGWSLWAPFSITVKRVTGKRPEVMPEGETKRPTDIKLFLHDNTTGDTSMYFQTGKGSADDQVTFCRVVKQQQRDKTGTRFTYDPSDNIVAREDCYILSRNDQQYCFDSDGRLIDVRKSGNIVVRYQRKNGQLVRIEDGSGHNYYDISYSKQYPKRIVEVVASDGIRMCYSFNQYGCLAYHIRENQIVEKYSYDKKMRLVEIRDSSDKVKGRYTYTEHDTLVSGQSDVVQDECGNRVARTIKDGVVVHAVDKDGAEADFRYNSDNALEKVDIQSTFGPCTLTFDRRGILNRIQSPQGRIVNLAYDPSEKLIGIEMQDSQMMSLKKYNLGQLSAINDFSGFSQKLEYDSRERLHKITTSHKARGTLGTLEVTPENKTITVKALATSQQAGRSSIKETTVAKLEYGKSGGITKVSNEVGTLSYEQNEEELTLTVRFKKRQNGSSPWL